MASSDLHRGMVHLRIDDAIEAAEAIRRDAETARDYNMHQQSHKLETLASVIDAAIARAQGDMDDGTGDAGNE